DEFAKDVGEFETIAELRADRRKLLEEAAERAADAEMRDKLLELAANNAQVELPEVMVEQELARMKDEFEYSLWARGLTLERYLQASEQTEEQLLERLRPTAEQRVKAELVLEAIAKAEQLEPTEEEIDRRLQELYASVKDSKERERLMADEDNRASVRDSLRRAKAMDFLIEHAQVSVVEVDPAEAASEAAQGETGTAADRGAPTAEAAGAAETKEPAGQESPARPE